MIDMQRFRSLMSEAGLSKYSDSIAAKALNGISVRCESAAGEVTIGGSKIGGMPDVPPGFVWPEWTPPVYPKKPGFFARLLGKSQPEIPPTSEPKPLAFLAQFDLSEVAPFDTDKRLPDSGMLYFFYDADECPWGYAPEHRGGWKVIYSDCERPTLQRTVPPQGLDQKYIFNECALIFSSEQLLPDYDSRALSDLGLSEEELDQYGDLMEEMEPEVDETHVTRLLGYPYQIQCEMMDQAQLVSHGVEAGTKTEFDDPECQRLLKDAGQWRLLFQIGSEDTAGMSWGDGGSLYFWIPQGDLAKRDFSNVWAILQCY